MGRGLEIKSDHNSSIRLARAGARVFLTWRSKSLACHFVAQTLRAQALKRNLRNKRKRMQTETQMAAALLISTAAMPPLTADHDGLTHNGRSARYGIKPACVNFRLAIQGNLSSLWHARCSVLHLGRRYAPLGHPGNAACLHGHARRAIDPERDITGYSALFQLRSVKHGGRRCTGRYGNRCRAAATRRRVRRKCSRAARR